MKIFSKLFLFFYFITITFSPSVVMAHVLETDGDIGGVIHLDPEDDPIAGQETSIYIDIKDKTNKFRSDQCSCTYTILRGEEQLYSGVISVHDSSDMTVHLSYTFPEKNIYTIQLHGNPLPGSVFQPFLLEYSVRVAREATHSSTKTNADSSQFPLIIAFLLGIGVCFFVLFGRKKKKLFTILVLGIFCTHLFPITIQAKEIHTRTHAVQQHSCCLPQQLILPHEFIVDTSITFIDNVHVYTSDSIDSTAPLQIHNRSP